MPPLVVLAVVGAVGYVGYILFGKLTGQAQKAEKTKSARMRREAGTKSDISRDLGELELDEKEGVYKPKSGK